MSGASPEMSKSMELLLREVLDGQKIAATRLDALMVQVNNVQRALLNKTNRLDQSHGDLDGRVRRIEEELDGSENIKGLKATVKSHGDKINMAYGGGAVLLVIGSAVGWVLEHIFNFVARKN